MTTDRCDRVWQVEALEDGRLEPKDRTSFERHSKTCPECSVEMARLQALRRIISEAPAAERTDLERRRARIALLRAANQRVVERDAPWRKARIWAIAAALPLLGLSALAFAHYASAPHVSGFEVVNVGQADWSAERVGTTSRVTLRAGVAAFHVDHVAGGARFLVMLPDGQIEVRGTRFIVDVASGKTRSVLVSEGVVALRVGGAERVLHASDRWQSDGDTARVSPSAKGPVEQPSGVLVPAAMVGAVAPTSASLVPNSVAALTVNNSQRPGGSPSSSANAPPTPSSAIVTAPSQERTPPTAGSLTTVGAAGVRFAEAVGAFDAGDYGRADSLFGAFTRDFPSDSRSEDATFLRADARARRGDKAGAAAGARAYLRAYPNGLRRPAAERLAEDRPPTPAP